MPRLRPQGFPACVFGIQSGFGAGRWEEVPGFSAILWCRQFVQWRAADCSVGKSADRIGGYTRVTRTGARRGDAAEMAVIELV